MGPLMQGLVLWQAWVGWGGVGRAPLTWASAARPQNNMAVLQHGSGCWCEGLSVSFCWVYMGIIAQTHPKHSASNEAPWESFGHTKALRGWAKLPVMPIHCRMLGCVPVGSVALVVQTPAEACCDACVPGCGDGDVALHVPKQGLRPCPQTTNNGPATLSASALLWVTMSTARAAARPAALHRTAPSAAPPTVTQSPPPYLNTVIHFAIQRWARAPCPATPGTLGQSIRRRLAPAFGPTRGSLKKGSG